MLSSSVFEWVVDQEASLYAVPNLFTSAVLCLNIVFNTVLQGSATFSLPRPAIVYSYLAKAAEKMAWTVSESVFRVNF